jgi:pyroglutamyl-peptidase
MKILITGFDPFNGEKLNPSSEAVKRLPDEIEGAEIFKLELPTVFGKSIQKLLEAIEAVKPDVTLCVGQNGGLNGIAAERVAINVMDAGIKDNEGNQPIDEPVYEDGAAAYFSSLPIKAIVKEIRDTGLPAQISNSAGTFVCNQTMYALLYNIEKTYRHMKGGFIHIPYIPEQVKNKEVKHCLPLEDTVKGLSCAVAAILKAV